MKQEWRYCPNCGKSWSDYDADHCPRCDNVNLMTYHNDPAEEL